MVKGVLAVPVPKGMFPDEVCTPSSPLMPTQIPAKPCTAVVRMYVRTCTQAYTTKLRAQLQEHFKDGQVDITLAFVSDCLCQHTCCGMLWL